MSSVQFEENVYYEQAEKPDVFHVTVTESPLAETCNLAGDYEFHINSMNFCLVDKKTKKPLFIWPYRYLRRYGKSNDIFQFEAGRKCRSGDGVCKLITKSHDAEKIFDLVQKKAKSIKARDEDASATTPNQVQETKSVPDDSYDTVEVKETPGTPTLQNPYMNTEPQVSDRKRSVKKKPTAPSQKPTAPGQKPTAPGQKPTTPGQKPTTPSWKPTTPSRKPTTPSRKPTTPGQKPTTPGQKVTTPGQKPTTPGHKPKDLNAVIVQYRSELKEQVADVDNTYGELATKPQPQLYADTYSCVNSNTGSAPPMDDANLYDVIAS